MSRAPQMDHIQCTPELHNDPTQDLQGDVPRNVKFEEEVICVKIKEEEIPTDVSPVSEKWMQTKWGSRMSKNIRDSDSESTHHGPEPYESSSEEAELSQAGPSQLLPVISPRHDTGRMTERGSKRNRKRRREEVEFMESVLHRLTEMNEERSRHLKEMVSQQEIIMRQLRDDEDSDMLFLKSLLPLMKEMPTPRKMECWTAMMDVMARFVAPSSTTHQPSQAPGPYSHAPPPESWYEPSAYSSAPSHSCPPHRQRLAEELGEFQYYPA
ncbi:uncharacterized protein LOC122939814 isoform X2 [Bufo gargarizans]|uniref:uncharacterized protein LOC122939814 isoform X2 n=1 Tax=Bufo gargarizans TaxID=30331 RepID=UPI001CF37907|nr:uncharacterized protein LOC122939814 isoform X2 [Bufo gargarizans]